MLKQQNKKVLGILIIVVVALLFIFLNQRDTQVPVVEEYEGKKVYTTDLSVDQAPLIADCDSLGGEFNVCGSPCGPNDDVCTAVCAYTCDF